MEGPMIYPSCMSFVYLCQDLAKGRVFLKSLEVLHNVGVDWNEKLAVSWLSIPLRKNTIAA